MTTMDPRLAARRRQVQESRARTSFRRLLWVLGVAIIGSGAWWVARSPMFSLSDLRVSGAVEAPVARLLLEAGVENGVPLVDIDVDSTESVLETDPWVVEATVTRDWPRALDVAVVERTAVAVAATSDGPVTVAGDGVVVSADPTVGLPVIEVPALSSAGLPGDRQVIGALEFLGALPEPLRVGTVARFGADGLEASVLGYAVRLGSPVDGAEKAAALAAVLQTVPAEGSVITVMAPNRPAVLPPGASGSTDESGDSETETGEEPQDG